MKGQTRNKRQLEVRAEPQGRASDGREGIVDAVASVFDVEYPVPGGREVIKPGAFRSVDGETLPVYNQHAHNVGEPPIGSAEARETDEGLSIRARLFLDESEAARSVFAALDVGALREWSIAFHPERTRERGDVTEVLKADVREVSTVLAGANPDTYTLSTRSGTLDRHRRRQRQEAAMQVGQVLANMTVPGSVEDRFIEAFKRSSRFRKLYERATA